MVRCKVGSALFLVGILMLSSSILWAAEGIISKAPDSSGTFCHLRFPAIREETLYGNRPVLKDPSAGDIVSFYGPCNYDPLGREEVLRQRADYRRRTLQLPFGD
jgi:hypothetical protein